MLKNKRGIELAFGTIITIIIAIVLLIFLIFMLAGGFNSFKEKVLLYLTVSNIDTIIENCNTLALQGQIYEYCCIKKTVKLSAKEKYELTCANISMQSWGNRITNLNCEGVC